MLSLVFTTTANQRVQVFCAVGGKPVVTSGVSSTTRVEASYPFCTINVYNTGSGGVHTTLYSDNSGTALANPFTADANGYGYFYAANGRVDVQISGGTPSVPAPVTYGDIILFDPAVFNQHTILAYPSAGVPGIIGVYDGSQTFYDAFTSPSTLAANNVWTLPGIDAAGCLASNGAKILSFISCGSTPGGPDTAVQFNSSGSFGGSANLEWSNTLQKLTLTGIAATPGLVVANGYIQTNGGLLTNVNSWQAVNSSTDGALLRGYNLDQNVSGLTGGYFAMAPVTYNPYDSGSQCFDQWGNVVTQPLPLNGLANFGTHNTVMWVSTSPSMPAGGSCGVALPVELDYGLNINSYFFARGGFATDQSSFNSIHSLTGGITALSFTAGGLYNTGTVTHCCGTLAVPTYIGGYMQVGHSKSAPAAGTITTVDNPLTAFDGLNAGTLYWDDTLHCLRVYSDSAAWACVGSGGSGSPGGGSTDVQFNSSGSFGGTGDFTWVTGHLTVVGDMNATVGFATTSTATNAIQAPNGGTTGKYITASESLFILEGTIPALSAAGQAKIVADTITHALYLSENGGAFAPLTGATAFSAITGSTNTSAAMVVGSGATLGFTGTGTISANRFNGGAAPANGKVWVSNSSLQPIAGVFGDIVALFTGGAGCTGTHALAADGTCVVASGGSGTPGGPDTSVQFNDTGSFNGSAEMEWNKTTHILTFTGTSTDTTSIGENFVYSLKAGVAGHTLFALGNQSGAGVLRVSLGTGTGGYDGNGATIYGNGSTGEFTTTKFISGGTGANFTFQNSNNNFIVDGDGNVSGAKVFSSTGALGGFNVTTNTASNSIQSVGGWKVNIGGAGETTFGAFAITPSTDGIVFIGGGVSNRVNGFFKQLNVLGASSQLEMQTGSLLSMDNGSTFSTGSSAVILVGGKLSTYNSTFVAGMGVAPIYSYFSATGQTTTQIQNLAVGGGIPPVGLYKVSPYVICSTATGSYTVFVNYYDGFGVQIGQSLTDVSGSGPTFSCSSSPHLLNPVVVHSDGTNYISVTVTALSGFGGGNTYRYYMTLEQLN